MPALRRTTSPGNNQQPVQPGQQGGQQPCPPPTVPTKMDPKAVGKQILLAALSVIIAVVLFWLCRGLVRILFSACHIDAPGWEIFSVIVFMIFILIIGDNVGPKKDDKEEDKNKMRTAIGVASTLILILYLIISVLSLVKEKKKENILMQMEIVANGREVYIIPKTFYAGELLDIEVKGSPCTVSSSNKEVIVTRRTKIPVTSTGRASVRSSGISQVTIYK